MLREQVVVEKEEVPHLAAVSYREILCQIGVEPCTLDVPEVARLFLPDRQ